MSDTSSVTIRVDSEDKRKAEQLFSSLGLNMSTAFNMFIKQSLLCEGLPFDVTLEKTMMIIFTARQTENILTVQLPSLKRGKASLTN